MENSLMSKITKLRFDEGLTLSEIAKKLNIDADKINEMIKTKFKYKHYPSPDPNTQYRKTKFPNPISGFRDIVWGED